MRKTVLRVVLTAFAALAVAVPAFAGPVGIQPPPKPVMTVPGVTSAHGPASVSVTTAPSSAQKPVLSNRNTVTTTTLGTVVYSELEKPHYEVVSKPVLQPMLNSGFTPPSRSYVLLGSQDFKPYLGKVVVVKGYLVNGPNIWMKPALHVLSIKSVRLPVPMPVRR